MRSTAMACNACATHLPRRPDAPAAWAWTDWRSTARMATWCTSSFLRIANQRTDQYGGSLEYCGCAFRSRFSKSCARLSRADRPVGRKVLLQWIGCRAAGTWRRQSNLRKELKKRGGDWITTSSAGISPLQKISVAPGSPGAVCTACARGNRHYDDGRRFDHGKWHRPKTSLQAQRQTSSRSHAPCCTTSCWAWHAAAELGATVDAPAPSYWRATPQGLGGLFRDALWREMIFCC